MELILHGMTHLLCNTHTQGKRPAKKLDIENIFVFGPGLATTSRLTTAPRLARLPPFAFYERTVKVRRN